MIALLLLAAAPAFDAWSGTKPSVVCLGDLDGDGADDFAAASRWEARMLVWILSSRDGRVLHRLDGEREGDGYGRALAAAGDVDGDGIGDLVVGAYPGGGRRAIPKRGYVDVISGRTGERIHRFASAFEQDSFGVSVGGGRDVDGDGVPDVVVGAPDRLGEVYVFSGRSGEPIRHLVGGPAGCRPHVPETESLPPPACSGLGHHVDLFPDVDGDGHAEIVCSTRAVARDDLGRVEVLSGRTAERLMHIEGEGSYEFEGFGWICTPVGDFDGDGRVDLGVSNIDTWVRVYSVPEGEVLDEHRRVDGTMVSMGSSLGPARLAPDGDDGTYLVGACEAIDCDDGYLRLYRGRDGRFWREWTPPPDDHERCGTGVDACALGDVDGDGTGDFALALPPPPGHSDPGRFLVLSGAELEPLWTRDYVELDHVPPADGAPPPDGE